MKRIVLPILIICLLALLAPALASAMTYDQAVDQLVADGCARDAEDYLTSLGTDPLLGFHLAGTWAEHDASYFVRDELQAMGLSDVRLEAVPVDAWDFKGATGRPSAGRTLHRLVVRGRPRHSRSARRRARVRRLGHGGGVRRRRRCDGKLVLFDGALDDWWLKLRRRRGDAAQAPSEPS